jgi:uncharacterized protein YndB with AHSA1/START domain
VVERTAGQGHGVEVDLLAAHMALRDDDERGFEAFQEFREIAPAEKTVSTEVFEGVPQIGLQGSDEEGTLNTTTFEDIDGGTRLSVLVECHTLAVRDAIIESGMEGGMQEGYDKLEQVAQSLAQGPPADDAVRGGTRRAERMTADATWRVAAPTSERPRAVRRATLTNLAIHNAPCAYTG